MFAAQIYVILGGMHNLEEELKGHFTDVVLLTTKRLQSWGRGGGGKVSSEGSNKCGSDGVTTTTCEVFGEQLLACIRSVHMP